MKTVLLLSGGLDSGSLLFWAKAKKFQIFPLFVNYGQPSYHGEWLAVKNLLKSLDLPPIRPVNVSSIGQLGYDALKKERLHIETQYYPSRNTLLLTLASILAYKNGANNILIGLVKDTAQVFADCSEQYVQKINFLLKLEHPKMEVRAPFITISKLDAVKESLDFGFNPSVTFCCNRFSDHHCWSCPSCADRLKILSELKMI